MPADDVLPEAHFVATRIITIDAPPAAVKLYWIPLGAGAHVVRVSGRVFEALSVLMQQRRSCHLYHSALEVIVPDGRFVIEMNPIPDLHGRTARRRGRRRR
jgi:hypothetical protein